MLRVVLHFTQAKLRPRATHTQATHAVAFSFSAMRSTALESDQYGDPMRVLEIKQAREANRAKREAEKPTKRPTITLKRGEWSDARKAAEALFDIPPRLGRS